MRFPSRLPDVPDVEEIPGEYSFVQSKQFLDLFRWYHASRIDKRFNKTLDELVRMMNDIAGVNNNLVGRERPEYY